MLCEIAEQRCASSAKLAHTKGLRESTTRGKEPSREIVCLRLAHHRWAHRLSSNRRASNKARDLWWLTPLGGIRCRAEQDPTTGKASPETPWHNLGYAK